MHLEVWEAGYVGTALRLTLYNRLGLSAASISVLSLVLIQSSQICTMLYISSSNHSKHNKQTHHPSPQKTCLLYTSPSPRDGLLSRMPSSA